MFNAPHETWLIPYLEGTLDEARRGQLESRLLTDSALASELEFLRQATGKLRAAAPPAVSPSSVWPAVQARLETEARPVPSPRRRLAWAGGLAASAALAVVAVVALKPSVRRTPAPSPPASVAMPSVAAAGSPTVKKAAAMPPPRAAPLKRRDPFRAAPRAAARHDFVFKPASKVAKNVVRPKKQPVPLAEKPMLMASKEVRQEAARDSENLVTASAENALALRKTDLARVKAASGSAPGLAGGLGGGAGRTMAPAAAAGNTSSVTAVPLAVSAKLAAPLAEAARTPAEAARTPAEAARLDDQSAQFGLGLNKSSGKSSGDRPRRLWAQGERRLALDAWQEALERAVKPPIFGDEAGKTLASQTLQSVAEAGAADAFRANLERRQTQRPRDIVLARVLAVAYAFSGESAKSRAEWERAVQTGRASALDWLSLAEAADTAGDSEAAKAAYQHVLDTAHAPALKDAARKRLAEPSKSKIAP